MWLSEGKLPLSVPRVFLVPLSRAILMECWHWEPAMRLGVWVR